MKIFNMNLVNSWAMFVIALINLVLSIFDIPEKLGIDNFVIGAMFVITTWCVTNVVFSFIDIKREKKAFEEFMKDFEKMVDEIKSDIKKESKKKRSKKDVK